MPVYTKAIQAFKNNRFQLAERYAKECLYCELEMLTNDEIYNMFFIIGECDIHKKSMMKAGK